jgi:hypothetical protein
VLDLGDPYPATVEVRDANGALVNAASMTFTFTLPDLTTTTSPAPANPSTGRYTHDLVTTQQGLHRFRAVSTGPAAVYADLFHVLDLTNAAAFINLATVKKQLNIPPADTSQDEELRDYLASACEVVEGIVGVVTKRTFVEKHSGGVPSLVLRHEPVVSIVAVTENGQTVEPSGYSLSDTGVLTRVSGHTAMRWACGVDNIDITLVAGRTIVPASILDGTRELIRINYRPQLGGNFNIWDSGGDQGDVQQEDGEVRLGFFVPRTVMERLAPHDTGPVIG